jgi:hypothetical protein
MRFFECRGILSELENKAHLPCQNANGIKRGEEALKLSIITALEDPRTNQHALFQNWGCE